MNKTKIPWVKNPDGTQGYSWNPITGCLNHVNGLCKGGGFPCYAYKLAHGRLKPLYWANDNLAPTPKDLRNYSLDPFYPRFWPEKLVDPCNKTTRWGSRRRYTQKSKGIFVCDMSDLFGIGVSEEWTRRVLNTIQNCPDHRFYLLTKQPQNLAKFSPFPSNYWVGVTVTSNGAMTAAMTNLPNIKAGKRFISFEPLLGDIGLRDHMNMKGIVNWVIIGSLTGRMADLLPLHHSTELVMSRIGKTGDRWTLLPQCEWVESIVNASDRSSIPVFIKPPLSEIMNYHRQEMPG